MRVNHGNGIISIFCCGLLSCVPMSPVLPAVLPGPVLEVRGMEAVADPIEGFREAVHLRWTAPEKTDHGSPRSYTLIRKASTDSAYDVFTGSRSIPSDTLNFSDRLTDFTSSSEGFDSIFYRIFAVDSMGRSGDTSEPCVFVLAPSPSFSSFDCYAGCVEWESWIRGGVFSWCTVWHETGPWNWTSERMEDFPETDKPARFAACLPDSLSPLPKGRWYCGLFIRIHGSFSLEVGAFDVH